MLPRSLLLSLLALAAVGAAPAAAASIPSLPLVERTLSAAQATGARCDSVTQARRGAAATTYVAPISGYANFRLAARGDWDLGVVDAASGRRIGASQGFGGQEVVQSWLRAGQQVRLVGCRASRRAGRSARISIGLLDVAPPKDAFVQTSLVRVFGTPEQTQELEELGLDVTHNVTGEYADVLIAGAGDQRLLARTGLRSSVRIADFDSVVRRTSAADAEAQRTGGRSSLPTGRETYRQYEDFGAELKKLAADFPDRVKPVVIGKSFQGRELQGVEIANDVNGADGRPVFFLMALHHAREWPSAEAAMEFATLLARDGNGDARLRNILDNARVVVVPLINPDGYVSSRESAPYDPSDNIRDATGSEANDEVTYTAEVAGPPGGLLTYRRKTCNGAIPDPSVPCALQYGIDPNRNYGEAWGGPGSSPGFYSQSYHGPGPWSEPETQAVHTFSQQRNVTMLITIHNVAALVLRPPGVHTNGKAPDEARMKAIGDAMAAATGYKSQYGFQLYDTTGTTEDWNYAGQSTYGYTIEMGPSDGYFHMPYETGFIKEWEGAGKHKGRGMREALIIGAEAAISARDHSVIAGKAPAGAVLRAKKSFITKTSEWCDPGVDFILNVDPVCPGYNDPIDIKDGVDTTTTVPASGRFEWHISPSIRPFAKPSEPYTLSCEVGGTVVEARDVVVARGQRLDLGPICGATADAAAAPSSSPAAPAPKAKAKKKAKRKKLTAKQRRAYRRCVARANRKAKRRGWSKARRAKARKACRKAALKVRTRRRL
jgi:hypothetical protein